MPVSVVILAILQGGLLGIGAAACATGVAVRALRHIVDLGFGRGHAVRPVRRLVAASRVGSCVGITGPEFSSIHTWNAMSPSVHDP